VQVPLRVLAVSGSLFRRFPARLHQEMIGRPVFNFLPDS